VQSNEPDDTRTFHFAIFADYHQVYLDDCQLADELTEWMAGIPWHASRRLMRMSPPS
jgi:hypothetical protein